MLDWLTNNKLPLGLWMRNGVDFMNDHAAGFFEGIAFGLEIIIELLLGVLQWCHPLLLISVIAVFAYWLHRSWKLSLLCLGTLLLIVNMGYWESTVETLTLVLLATLICMMIGIPLGIASAHRPWLYQLLRPVLDLMQTIPTFVYLIPTLILFGLGMVPGIISTVIFALPAPVRLTHLGISSVPSSLREAALAFGATKHQLLWKIELPHATPTIMAGLTQCIMLSLSMVVIAALVGADGLGKPVVRALNSVNVAMGFEAGLAIVFLAILLDRVFKQPERR